MEDMLLTWGISFLVGAFGAGIYGLVSYQNNKSEDNKVVFEPTNFAVTMFLGGVAIMFVQNAGIDIETIALALTAIGASTSAKKAINFAVNISDKFKKKK